MKIFYACQNTGSGHTSRLTEILPYLQEYGEVDIFLSGNNNNLPHDFPVKYQSKGLSLFYDNSGGLSYLKTIRNINVLRCLKEAKDLPVEKYDLVINDFEFITSLACRVKKVNSINLGHQASFISEKTPRPRKRDFIGEFLLKNFGAASQYVGFHFKQYDDFIYPPVIKKSIIDAEVTDKGHITVYLSQYDYRTLKPYLLNIPDIEFDVFTSVPTKKRLANITINPLNSAAFTQSMINSHGVITGGGFETPAEVLYLKKKLLCLPIKGQYEQLCNAEALRRDFGVTVLEKGVQENFSLVIKDWLYKENPLVSLTPVDIKGLINKIVTEKFI